MVCTAMAPRQFGGASEQHTSKDEANLTDKILGFPEMACSQKIQLLLTNVA
jgi:hypothetical protein